MTERDGTQDTPRERRTTREIIDEMPTPTDVASTFLLFAALEQEAIEEGRSTPEESAKLLQRVFRPDQD